MPVIFDRPSSRRIFGVWANEITVLKPLCRLIPLVGLWDRHPATVATIRFPDVSVHTGLPMMTLKPFELGDHHPAGWDQRVALSVGKGSHREGLGEARIGSSFFGRIVRSSDNQPLNHFPGVLDAISWDAAAMSVTQKEASRLSKLDGIGGLGDTTAGAGP